MGARSTDPLVGARRWLEDCLTSAKRWQQTEAPPKAPAYLPQVICERLRASVRMVRQLQRQLACAQQEEADAREKHAELARVLRQGPVTRGHRNNMRRVSAKAERAKAQADFYLEGLAIAKGNLKAAAERVQKSIEAAGARLNGEYVIGRQMPYRAAEIQAEREKARREEQARLDEARRQEEARAEEARRQEQARREEVRRIEREKRKEARRIEREKREEAKRLEQEKRDALVALELARNAKNRAAALEVVLKLAKPVGYPCTSCAHGRALTASETGWDCTAGLYRICKPWTPEPERWAPRA